MRSMVIHLIVLISLAQPVYASDLDCGNKSGEIAIKSCTKIINSKQIHGKKITTDKLAITFGKRGDEYLKRGETNKAIADYNEALRLAPKYIAARNNRGAAWKKKGEYDKAIADYNEVLRINPKYANAYYNRGNVWFEKGDHDKAIKDFNEVLRINPKYINAYYNRGNA